MKETIVEFDQDEVGKNGLPGLPKLTDEQADALIEWFHQCGNSRKQAQGENMSEPDFIAGGMAFLQGLGLWNHLPASWVFRPMIGEQIFEPIVNGPSQLQRANEKIERLEEILTAYVEEYGELEVPEHMPSIAEMYAEGKRRHQQEESDD